MFCGLCRNRSKRKSKKISSQNDRNATCDADREVYHVLECNGGADPEGADLYDLVSSSETSHVITASEQNTKAATDDLDIYDSVGDDNGKANARKRITGERRSTEENEIEMVDNTAYEPYELGLLQSTKTDQFIYDQVQGTSKSSMTIGPNRKRPLHSPDLNSKQMMSQTMPRMTPDMSQLATTAASKAKELFLRRKTSPGSSVRSRHSVNVRSASETIPQNRSFQSMDVITDNVFESPKKSKCHEELSGSKRVTNGKTVQVDIQREVLEHAHPSQDIDETLDEEKEIDTENSIHAEEVEFEINGSNEDKNKDYEFVTAKLQLEIKQALCRRSSAKFVNERTVPKTSESSTDSVDHDNEPVSVSVTSRGKHRSNYENFNPGDMGSEPIEEEHERGKEEEEEEEEKEEKNEMEDQEEMNSSNETQSQIENGGKVAINNVEPRREDRGNNNDDNVTDEKFVFFTEQSFSKIEEDVVIHETLSKGEVKYAPLTLSSRKRQVRRFSL